MTQEKIRAEGLASDNPLASDLALFDMYIAALDVVLADPEIVIALEEFGLHAGRLRAQMVGSAGKVLRTAAPEFAAYEVARASDANSVEIDPQTITIGTRLDPANLIRLIVRAYGVTGIVLLASGLSTIWYWWPAIPLVGAGGALLVSAGMVPVMRWAAATEYGRMVVEGAERSNSSIELQVARSRLMSVVSRSELLEQVRAFINTERRGRFSLEFSVSSAPGLSEVYDYINRVPTAISAELDELLGRVDGGSIGIAGPRGSGKSMLIRQYCEEVVGGTGLYRDREDEGWARGGSSSAFPFPDLRCMVAAPVDYAAHDFVLHMFATLCRAVIQSYGSGFQRSYSRIPARAWLRLVRILMTSLLARAIVFGGAAAALWYWESSTAHHLGIHAAWVKYTAVAAICIGGVDWIRSSVKRLRKWGMRGPGDALVTEARNQLAKVRYVQTYTAGLSGGFKLPAGGQAQLSRAVSRAEQPLSYPEVVDEFRSFARTVAYSMHEGGARVFIGVDELDKIGSAEQAERFLNEIKGIFGIAHVYFIVSVSDDALTAFERRGLPLRDAFDSSFDEIIHVGPLSYGESRRLLYRRVVGLSEPYVALCHCLSGGLARDLIRSARSVVRAAARLGDPPEPGAIPEDDDWENPVNYVLMGERPVRVAPTVEAIAGSVVRDELRRKIRATSYVADGLKGHDTTELQRLFYDIVYNLSHGESIGSASSRLIYPLAFEPTPVADLRMDIAAYAYYCTTLDEIFTGQLTGEQIVAATGESISTASFDTLAAARNALALDAMLAWHLITEFRAGWSLETWQPPQECRQRQQIDYGETRRLRPDKEAPLSIVDDPAEIPIRGTSDSFQVPQET